MVFDEDGITELLQLPDDQELRRIDRAWIPGYRSEAPKRKTTDILLQYRVDNTKGGFMRHLMSPPLDFSVEELDILLDLAQDNGASG